MGLLDNKVVLVTGGGSGIGQSTARSLAADGASVVVCDIDDDGGERAVEQMRNDGLDATYVHCDVTLADEVDALLSYVLTEHGRLDGAFNNAGIEGVAGTAGDYDESEWDKVLSVNLKGIWLCLRAEVKAMQISGGGAIVNTSSALGAVGIANLPAYVASKHGVIGLTRAAAIDHARDNIRINAVAPGVIDTPLMSRRIEEMPEIEAPLRAAHPLGRIGATTEVADTVCWLLSDRASFVHGAVVSVDGGYLAI